MKYKCIIFDCDGVLVDSELITAKVLVAMGKDLGLHIDLDFVTNEFLGKSLNDIMQYLDVLVEGHLPANFELEYRKKTYKAFKNEIQPIEGIHSVIENLEVPFCVASSGPLEKIRANLTTTGLIDKFEGRIFSCYEIQSWKPNPDIFLHAAKNMGFRPEECAVVEDSEVGVQAALAGGFDVFLYSKNGHEYPNDLEVASVFQEMSDLEMLLSQS
ncbi:HAD-IA family hydrolase [Ulvibacterium sp.]|uniref:HAD-IA family hydrolase n=1 Tax=Ulvibacterium sp. TaxID=2665914 RepID=UPI002625B047|nr:HAD-IA family hydrolase [Ulvibacterium sp.]